MIKILTLKVSNFTFIENQDFDFDRPLIILTGKSGQGKSSILDQIVLCWRGSKFGRDTKISEYVKQGCELSTIDMTAEFFTKPINFHLEIEAKGPFKRTITYEGKQYSGNDATELIESFDVDDYFRIFGMLQDEPDIASLSAGAARWYIEKLLNFNYDDQLNVIKSEIEDLENNEDTMMKSITVNETIISSSANRIKEMEQPRYTDDQISRAKSLQKTLKEKLKTHDDQVAAKQKVDTALREAETQLSSVRSRLVKEEQRMSQYASLDTALKAAQEELSRRCDEALSMHAAYDDAVEAQENLEELDDYEKAEKAAETKKNKIMSQIETFKRYKSSIDEGVCPHCGQETTQHAADLLIKDFGSDDVAVIKKQLDADLKKATDEYSQAKKEKNDVMIAHSNAAAQVKNAEANLKKANLAETAATQKKDELVAQKANAPRDNRPSLVSSEATLLDKIEALQKEAETITVDPIDGVKQELDDATIMITNFDEWVRNKDKIIAQENEIITEKTKEIAETKDQLAVTRNKIDMRKSAQGHVKMLRNYRVVETSQQLEAGMNEIIHCVFPDYVVRLEQTSTGVKFFYSHTTSATSKTNNWLGAKMSSGFERSLLNAAFRLTLCREYGLPICLLDEIDGHADDDSSQALYEFIFSCGLFQQSFIISHKKIIKNTVVDLDLGAYIYEAKGGKFRRVS